MLVMDRRKCLLAALLAHQARALHAFVPLTQGYHLPSLTAPQTQAAPATRLHVASSSSSSTSASSSTSSSSLPSRLDDDDDDDIQIEFSTSGFSGRTPSNGSGRDSSSFQHNAVIGKTNGKHQSLPSKQPEKIDSTSSVLPVSSTAAAITAGSRSPQLRPKKTKQKIKAKKTFEGFPDGKRPRNNNKAMNDVAFLRKRTKNLLTLTESMLQESVGEHAEEESTDGAIGDDVAGSKKDEVVTATGSMKVGRKSFHFLMDAWAFSGELDGPDQAMSLLIRMEELWDATQRPNIQPDVRSYTKVMNAYSRSMRQDAGPVTRELLHHMSSVRGVAPNAYTYATVIEAYANSGADGAAQNCEELCENMVQLFLENQAKRASGEYVSEDEDVRPTARCFNAAISAYGKNGEAHQAEYMFDRMEDLYWKHPQELPDMKPSQFNYNTLITAWANCAEHADSAARAEDVLMRLQHDPDCEPTTVSYNSVIDAFAKAGDPQRAEAILKLMNQKKGIQPNTRSFNTVINAWAKSRDADAASRAEDLLDRMSQMAKEGNKNVRPDAHSFCTAINAWARSQRPGKAERANNMFREMSEMYEAGNKSVRPNVVAVNAVINACAYTSDRHGIKDQQRAIEIAHKRLQQLEASDYGSPDQITYGTFFKVCANQMPDCDSRRQLLTVLFKKCCRDGQVGNMVLNELRNMGPEDLYEKLVGRSIRENVRMEDLPQEWWCNVVEGKWRRRRNN